MPEEILRKALVRVGNLSSMVTKLGMLVRKVLSMESRERMAVYQLDRLHAQSHGHWLRESP